MLIYLDACIVIYLVEQTRDLGPRASARIGAALKAGDQFVVSDLTRLECRSIPLAAGDTITLEHFDRFFAQSVQRVVGLSTAVCDRATEIRATHRFKTPDALHLSAALDAGCELFLTNDTHLARFAGLTVELLA